MNEEAVIIGYGITGKATAFALEIEDHIDTNTSQDLIYEYILHKKIFIICLPTPTVDGKQDLSLIHYYLARIFAYSDVNDKIIIIRSTVLPGTTERLSEGYELNIAHVPEFLTESTAIEDACNPDFLVIGFDDILIGQRVKNFILQSGNFRTKKLLMCSTATAELIKYSMNSWFALKVIMANQLFDIAEKTGADYSKVTRALEEHKWGSKNGWDVWHRGYRGFGGKCLPKDVEAFANKFDVPLMKKVHEINQELTKTK